MQAFTTEPPRIDPDKLRFVGFSRRLGAALIDALTLAPLALLAYYFTVAAPSLYGVLVISLLDAIYKPFMERNFGATVGKQVLKMRVVSESDYGNIDWNQALMRYLPWAIVFFTSVFTTIRLFQDPNFGPFEDYMAYIDFVQESPVGSSGIIGFLQNIPIISAVWISSDPLSRALHDRFANTLVVDLR